MNVSDWRAFLPSTQDGLWSWFLGFFVAYMIARPYQRQGYAKEALVRLIDYLRRERRIRRFFAEISPANAASCALIRSLGFERVASDGERLRLEGDVLFALPESSERVLDTQ